MRDVMLTSLQELRPRALGLVMDLVREAGIDVSDWANFKGGESKAASNPKYCYEWSFLERGKVAVLNLWWETLKEEGGRIFLELNMRAHARKIARMGERAAWERRAIQWERRAINMDVAIQAASRQALPVRVILCDGARRDLEGPTPEPSKVKARSLDDAPWTVTSYDWETGDCVLTRDGVAVGSQLVD